VSLELDRPTGSVIVFQYNPETMSRQLQVQGGGEADNVRSDSMRPQAPPAETITLQVELDATDQLERGDATATALGLYPQLTALEALVYPLSSRIVANAALLAAGTMSLIAPAGPLTLFVWGPRRVLPVRVTSFGITEEAYDNNLNPIRATVALGLRVLTYNDLSATHPGYHVSLAHQVVKETLAALGTIRGAGGLAGAVGFGA
jgi:hypothetical protein